MLNIVFEKLRQCSELTSRKERVAVATLELRTMHMPMLLPHAVTASLLVSYPHEKWAGQLEAELKSILQHKGLTFRLETLSSRPAMKERRANARLMRALESTAQRWEIPLRRESSVWPSVAGLVPASAGVVCGVGPVAQHLYTPDESVDRISLLQRTLLIAEFLANDSC
jgi:hypothetical protein